MTFSWLAAPPRPRDPRAPIFWREPEQIAPGVELLRGGATATMNAYLLAEPSGAGVAIFDTGEQSMAPAILRAATTRGGITRVVLGHADTDHRGAAAALRAAGRGAFPIECHPDARVHAEGDGGRSYWRQDQLPLAVRAFHGVMHHLWDGGPVTIDQTIEIGSQVAGFEVIDLAGHAPGQIGLWRAADRVALVSDTLYVTTMFGHPQPPAVPIAPYNFDQQQARASLRRLADLEPRIVCPGHLGPLIGDDLGDRLRAAADAQ